MSLRCLAVLGVLAALVTPALAEAPAPRAVAMTRAAQSVARRGECSALPTMAAAVRDLDPIYYEDTFLTDPVIAACQQGIDTTPAPPPAPVPQVVADSAPVGATIEHERPADCAGVRAFFEPSLWAGPMGSLVRHSIGAGIHQCSAGRDGFALRLGGRLDIGVGNVFLGADAELTHPVNAYVSVGLIAGYGEEEDKQTLVGLRVRTKYVWVGADWMKVGHGDMEESTGVMFGVGINLPVRGLAGKVGAHLSESARRTWGGFRW